MAVCVRPVGPPPLSLGPVCVGLARLTHRWERVVPREARASSRTTTWWHTTVHQTPWAWPVVAERAQKQPQVPQPQDLQCRQQLQPVGLLVAVRHSLCPPVPWSPAQSTRVQAPVVAPPPLPLPLPLPLPWRRSLPVIVCPSYHPRAVRAVGLWGRLLRPQA